MLRINKQVGGRRCLIEVERFPLCADHFKTVRFQQTSERVTKATVARIKARPKVYWITGSR
ncbi:MAG: hypothetical protein ABGX07_05615 [Pirellulaceae bacterium]|nr:hypothetical protein [Planctomycetaceae bacterium]